MSVFSAEYRSKLVTMDDVLDLFRDGDVFSNSQCAGEPNTFLDSLHKLHGRVSGLTMLDGLTMREHPFMVDPQYEGLVYINSNFMMGPARKAAAMGRLSYNPGDLHNNASRWLEYHKPRIFVGMVAPMDDHGFFTMSMCLIHEMEALEASDIVVLEVNPRLPRVFGDTEIHIRDVDYLVEVDTPLPILPKSVPNPAEQEIGRYVASLIQDGDCIQLGIGGIPDAISQELMGKHDLGVHTEMINTGMVELAKAGVINGKKKNLNKGKLVADFAMGEQSLYDYLDMNPSILIKRGTYVNNPMIIMQNDNMVSVNTALSVDLTGQVCSESIGQRQYSGVGGQFDTAFGAMHSKNGRAIIALESTRKNGTISNIVSALAPGSAVSLTRNCLDYVVTEYGIARMRGANIRERIEALISIAHPDFRAELRKEAEKII